MKSGIHSWQVVGLGGHLLCHMGIESVHLQIQKQVLQPFSYRLPLMLFYKPKISIRQTNKPGNCRQTSKTFGSNIWCGQTLRLTPKEEELVRCITLGQFENYLIININPRWLVSRQCIKCNQLTLQCTTTCYVFLWVCGLTDSQIMHPSADAWNNVWNKSHQLPAFLQTHLFLQQLQAFLMLYQLSIKVCW